MNSEYVYLSKEGFEKLKAELHELRSVKRPQVVNDIKRAREHGDLSENAEYHAAKEAQTHIERKIAELEFKLSRAQVVTGAPHGSDTVALLSRVKLKDQEDGEEVDYLLVSAAEADLLAGKISIESPVGKALVGRKVGDEVKVKTPGGEAVYKVLQIQADLA
jgi:transcription elongation factor GreA